MKKAFHFPTAVGSALHRWLFLLPLTCLLFLPQIAPDGTVSVIYKSKNGGSVIAGLFDWEGNLWLPENSESGGLQVEKLAPATLKSQVETGRPLPWVPVAALCVVMLVVFFFVRRRVRKR